MVTFLPRFPDRWLFLVLVAAVLIRLLTLDAYPLADNTEARYAESAREMAATGNWISPQLHGEKYWSKPPLALWATAGAMKIFGPHEFAARLPHLLFSLVALWLLYRFALRERGRTSAWAATVILATSTSFFICSSAVMTDAALLLGTTLSMIAFWHALSRQGAWKRAWGYLFFLGLAISMMAKGPVGWVLTGAPIGIWVIWNKQWRQVWQGLPWGTGLLLTAALTIPWYLAAEARTPGFLHYFFVGEHWYRFVRPGWKGDLYGNAHSKPRGMIWLMWVMAAFPWSFLLLGVWIGSSDRRRRIVPAFRNMDAYQGYLLLWAITPMLFFTLAGNILWTYVLPGMPAFALLMAGVWHPQVAGQVSGLRRFATGPALGFCVPLAFGCLILIWPFLPIQHSQKYLVSRYLEFRPQETSRLIYFFERPYSAEFYSSGEALEFLKPEGASGYFADGVQDFFVIEKRKLNRLPASFQNRLTSLSEHEGFVLLGETILAEDGPGLPANTKQQVALANLPPHP